MKLDFPATSRNREPIAQCLASVLPASGLVLELASGSGQHAAWFAQHLAPGLRWLPSDPDPTHRASIAAWTDGMANVTTPLDVDVLTGDWPEVVRAAAGDEVIAAILCINMIHIAPWPACLALMRGAEALLPPGGALYLYGPFAIDGAHTAPSNAAFDASLIARNPAWGVRDLQAVSDAAAQRGLVLSETVTMPANNLSLLFRRTASGR